MIGSVEGLVNHAQKTSVHIQAKDSVAGLNKMAKWAPLGWEFDPTGKCARS